MAAMTLTETKAQGLNLSSITQGGLTWIDISPPTRKEIDYLAAHFPFHPLDLDDTLSRIQRPKIDDYKDYLFLILHFPRYYKREKRLAPTQLAVFVGEDYLITLHQGELKPLVKLFHECQIDDETRQEYLGQGSAFLLYRILDRLFDYCLPILDKVANNLENIEEELLRESRSSELTWKISHQRRDIIVFRRIIWPMRPVVVSLEPRLRRFANEDLSVYFGDLMDHVDKIWDGLEEYKEIIEGLGDTSFMLSSERTNEVMRLLTVIATVLLPITMVASIWGMNVPLPFANSDLALLYISLITVGIIGGMLAFFHHLHII